MTEIELKLRLREFAIRVLNLCSELPNTPNGWAFARQLTRSGTSPGANYRSACRARSKADFVAKLAIAEEEMDESEYWLDLIMATKAIQPSRVMPLFKEAGELLRILIASRITAKTALAKEEQSRKRNRDKIENRKSENRKSP